MGLGIGGVAGSALIGRPLDRLGATPFLIALPTALVLSFVLLWLVAWPFTWLIAVAIWGASGWASVPTLQKALTHERPSKAMAIVAFQMAAMYLGSAAGAGVGSSILANGTNPNNLPAWTLIPGTITIGMVIALVLSTKRATALQKQNCPA